MSKVFLPHFRIQVDHLLDIKIGVYAGSLKCQWRNWYPTLYNILKYCD